MELKLGQVSKNFGKKAVLCAIDYTFQEGVYGLLGPNGAGKTTLLRCIAQLYPLSGGSIAYNGKPASGAAYQRQIGYLPQKFGLFPGLKVFEMLALMADLKGVPKSEIENEVYKCVEMVNLTDRIGSKVRTLSGGMVRRLGIAQALLGNPAILLLDEPTAGLDPEERLRFKNIITGLQKDRVILISTHIVADVEALCDHVVVMNDGRFLAAGTCAEIQSCADGRMYEIPESQVDSLVGTCYIQRQVERGGVRVVQFLSAERQTVARPIEPTVEDGYIWVLKEG